MPTKRVAVLVNRSLLMAGVVAMLREQEGLAITVIRSDATDRMDRLSELDPSAVVIEQSDRAFSGTDSIWCLAERHPEVTVISVAADSDHIHALAPRSVLGARASDLLGLILCGPSSLTERADSTEKRDGNDGGQ